MTFKKDHRKVKATVVMTLEVFLDETTEPEDVFNDMYISSDHGRITETNVVHTAITKIKKL